MSSLLRSTDRLNNFSDGVFGVAITVLIVPVFNQITEPPAKKDLLALIHDDLLRGLAVWFLSVGVVGTFWIAHHNILHLVKRWDRWLLWINTAFLMSVTFLPVPMAILANYWLPGQGDVAFRDGTIGLTAYGVAVIVSSGWLYAIWAYMTRHRELLWEDVNTELFEPVKRQIRKGPAVYLTAIVLAWLIYWSPLRWLSIWPALLLFGVVQVWYMMPGNIDRDAERRSARPPVPVGE